MKLTYQHLLDHPELFERLAAEAKRERAREIDRLVLAPIAAFFHRPAKAKAAAALTVACS